MMRVNESNSDDSIEESPRLKLDMRPIKAASESKKETLLNTGTQHLLKEEILQLEKRLQDQFVVRRTLEKALMCGPSYCDTIQTSMPKPATELIREIAVLELEVGYLEQYLLSLYRKAYDQSSTGDDQKAKSVLAIPRIVPRKLFTDDAAADTKAECHTPRAHSASKVPPDARKDSTGLIMEEKVLDSGVGRGHSLTLQLANPAQSSPPMHLLSKDTPSSHSQPLSMAEYAKNSGSNIITLAEHLGTRISDHVPETPNSISEEMVKCMASVFCKLADPPSAHNALSSPNSSSFSMGGFSPNHHCDLWSPGLGRDSSFDVRLDNPFNIEGLKEFSGPYSTMVEVPCICRENQKLYLICRLLEIDPKKDETRRKACILDQCVLAYGIPQNNVKTMFLILKAAYNIGGHAITADTIQSTILGCRTTRPAQWLRMIISPKTKFKIGDYLQSYAIENPEPLLHFALCSGSHSDPAIRVYTPKRVFQELKGAKEDIRATFGIRKDQKILLPNTKDAAFSAAGIVEMIQQSLPNAVRKTLKKCQVGKPKKSIEWLHHNFSFRYLISKELVK